MNLVIHLGLCTVVALGLWAVSNIVNRIMTPRGRSVSRAQAEPYECGMVPLGSAEVRFPLRFATLAMLFILFDIEIAFLVPWAVVARGSGAAGLAAALGFAAVLAGGLVYAWARGGLKWE